VAAGDHWLVVPLFGKAEYGFGLADRLLVLQEAGFGVVLVDNNRSPSAEPAGRGCFWVHNGNRGGIAGGFNRGVEAALARGARTITLLDQDSRITTAALQMLQELLERHPGQRLLVGPRIWDQRRQQWHQPVGQQWRGYPRTRLLISSGTTFSAEHWALLGPLDEQLFIDFVDHAWCFRAQAAGFVLLQHPHAELQQQFGQPHPHWLCRHLGLELYSPQRHFYSLRNLRWLVRQGWVPLDLRCKEVIKMLLKPWLWLLFEPKRSANVRAILAALRGPLPHAARAAR
jgi:rhamnosyltransferase